MILAHIPDSKIVTSQIHGTSVYVAGKGTLSSSTLAERLQMLLPPVDEGFVSAQRFVSHQAESDERYKNIPSKTQTVIDWCERHKIPVFVGPNTAHTLDGCEGAVLVRDRIIAAQESVPVYDELKSLLWTIRSTGKNNQPGETLYIATHIRGNRLADIDKVKRWLEINGNKTFGLEFGKSSFKKLRFVNDDDLEAKFKLEKGQVTPWIEAQRPQFLGEVQDTRIIHIFDTDCRKSFGMGMTTNAHDGDWATEFDSEKIIDQLKIISPETVFEAPITLDGPSKTLDQITNYQGRVMGVLEYGIEATMLFREKFEAYRKAKISNLKEPFYTRNERGEIVQQPLSLEMAGTFSEPTCKTASDTKLERVMRPDLYGQEVQQRVNHLVRDLVAQGANTIMIPCNILPKYVTDLFCPNRIPILRMNHALYAKLMEQDDDQTVLFLGGGSVHHPDLSIYQNLPTKRVTLNSDEITNIEQAMMRINNGQTQEADRFVFEVLKNQTEIGTLILAATSFSAAFAKRGFVINPKHFTELEQPAVKRINELNILDTLDVYAEYCAEKMLANQRLS